MTHEQHTDTLIVGGGLSGTLLAAHLLRLPGQRKVTLAEPRAELGQGEAYSATELGHTLNGNAARMGVDPDNPNDLTEWLQAHILAGGWPESAAQDVSVAELFPPRGLFGLYARQRLAEAQAVGARQGSGLLHVRHEVTDLQPRGDGAIVRLADGSRWSAGQVVLATGMFTASRTRQLEGPGAHAASADPWDVEALKALDPQGTVLVIGSGLTMVDALVSLERAGHRGPIRVFSRHGLLPHVRRQPPAWPDFLDADRSLRSPRQVMHALREQCAQAMAQGIDWQAPLDTVRVHIGRLWSQASEHEKRQFTRHMRPWWESHHHRSPPQGARLLERLLAERRVTVEAATLLEVDRTAASGVAIAIRRRGETHQERIEGVALIDSSGIQYDWRKVDRHLPRNLLQRGLVRPGPLGLGIDADTGGAVKAVDGTPSAWLFAMGPPLRGLWWESTAVPDIALQARALARRLV